MYVYADLRLWHGAGRREQAEPEDDADGGDHHAVVPRARGPAEGGSLHRCRRHLERRLHSGRDALAQAPLPWRQQ